MGKNTYFVVLLIFAIIAIMSLVINSQKMKIAQSDTAGMAYSTYLYLSCKEGIMILGNEFKSSCHGNKLIIAKQDMDRFEKMLETSSIQ